DMDPQSHGSQSCAGASVCIGQPGSQLPVFVRTTAVDLFIGEPVPRSTNHAIAMEKPTSLRRVFQSIRNLILGNQPPDCWHPTVLCQLNMEVIDIPVTGSHAD